MFLEWLTTAHPEITTLTQLTRKYIEEYHLRVPPLDRLRRRTYLGGHGDSDRLWGGEHGDGELIGHWAASAHCPPVEFGPRHDGVTVGLPRRGLAPVRSAFEADHGVPVWVVALLDAGYVNADPNERSRRRVDVRLV